MEENNCDIVPEEREEKQEPCAESGNESPSVEAPKKPRKSITKNSIFFLIYNVLNVLFPFVTGVYVARVLFPDDIGKVAYAQNIVQYFVTFAFLGIPTYSLRAISKVRDDREELNKIHSELFFINLISTFVFLGLYLALIFSVERFRANLTLHLIVGALIALNAIDNSWLYEALEEFKYITIRNFIFKIVAFVVLLAFVRKPEDYYMYAAITVIGTAGNFVFNMVHCRKFIRFRTKGLNFRRHLKPVFMLVLVNLAIEIYTLVDITMLGIFCPDANIAYYSYGCKIYKIFLQVLNTFTIVMVPRLSVYYGEGRTEEYNALITKTLKVLLTLAIPVIVGIQFVSKFFITAVYGAAYENSALVLRVFSPMLLISPLGYLLGSRVLLVAGKEWKMAISVGAGAVVNIVGNYFLIRAYSEIGAAAASLISEFVVMVVYICLSHRYFKLKRFWDTLLKVVAASAVMGGYLFGCSYIPINGWAVFVIQFSGAVAIYFGLLLLFKENLVKEYAVKIFDKIKGFFPQRAKE